MARARSSDQYGVVSLYLDTDARDVYHRRRSYGRSKFRIRHYESDEAAFLERKLRTRLRLTKRRTRIPVEAVSSLRLDDPDPTHPGYWFFRRVHAASPSSGLRDSVRADGAHGRHA